MSDQFTIYQVSYLEHATKFYRIAILTDEATHGYWVVTNWGAGNARGDARWEKGQRKAEFFTGILPARIAADTKRVEKTRRGYTATGAFQAGAAPANAMDVPPGMIAPTLNPGVRFSAKVPPPPKPVKVSIHTKDGVLKPALANRTRWRAQE